jgi:hypothetical protein
LHLHGRSELTNQRSLFSEENAPGILVGVGNVGEHLVPVDQCNTYLSTDAGKTWKEIQKGPYLHFFANFGSVIALLDMSGATKQVM